MPLIPPLRQLARYGTVSVLSAAITLGIPPLLHEGFGINERVAVAVALGLAFVVNFIAFQGWVFGQASGARRSFTRFAGVSIGFRVTEYLAFLLLLEMARIPYFAALVIILIISFCLKFVTYRRFVFTSDRSGAA